MKDYIVYLLLLVITSTTAQPTVDSIPVLKAKANQVTNSIIDLYSKFCMINAASKSDGDKLLEFAQECDIRRKYAHQLFNNGFECMSEDQRDDIRSSLSSFLKTTDPYFFELVSFYEMSEFEPFLEAHVPKNRNIEDRLVKAMKSLESNSYDGIKFELMCMGTLAHFNDSVAVELVDLVNNAHRRVEAYRAQHPRIVTRTIGFYLLLKQVMANVKRRDVIIKTLPLLDVKPVYDHNGAHGIVFFYYQQVILPLVDDSELYEWLHELLSEDNKVVQEAVVKIKAKLQNDDSVWKDFVKK